MDDFLWWSGAVFWGIVSTFVIWTYVMLFRHAFNESRKRTGRG